MIPQPHKPILLLRRHSANPPRIVLVLVLVLVLVVDLGGFDYDYEDDDEDDLYRWFAKRLPWFPVYTRPRVLGNTLIRMSRSRLSSLVSSELPRRLPVAPLIGDKRCYGEPTGSVR
jgi:hypothetical protein